jgi:hypothetical protein
VFEIESNRRPTPVEEVCTALTKATTNVDGFVRDVDPRNTRQRFMSPSVYGVGDS